MSFDLRRVLSALLLVLMGFLGVILYLDILLQLMYETGQVMSAHRRLSHNLDLRAWIGLGIPIVYFLLSFVLGSWSTFKAWQVCSRGHFRNSIGWALVPLILGALFPLVIMIRSTVL